MGSNMAASRTARAARVYSQHLNVGRTLEQESNLEHVGHQLWEAIRASKRKSAAIRARGQQRINNYRMSEPCVAQHAVRLPGPASRSRKSKRDLREISREHWHAISMAAFDLPLSHWHALDMAATHAYLNSTTTQLRHFNWYSKTCYFVPPRQSESALSGRWTQSPRDRLPWTLVSARHALLSVIMDQEVDSPTRTGERGERGKERGMHATQERACPRGDERIQRGMNATQRERILEWTRYYKEAWMPDQGEKTHRERESVFSSF